MEEKFRTLGHETRLRIVRILAERGEVCVCSITDQLGARQPAVSHHMRGLSQAGLLNSRREAQWIYYSLNVKAFETGPLAFLRGIVLTAERHAGKSMDRLL